MSTTTVATSRVAAAATVPRELRLDATTAFDPAPCTRCLTPTLLLLGEHSPAGQRSLVRSADDALLDRRIVVLPGQEHVAQATAPELVAQAPIRSATGSSTSTTSGRSAERTTTWARTSEQAPSTSGPSRSATAPTSS